MPLAHTHSLSLLTPLDANPGGREQGQHTAQANDRHGDGKFYANWGAVEVLGFESVDVYALLGSFRGHNTSLRWAGRSVSVRWTLKSGDDVSEE